MNVFNGGLFMTPEEIYRAITEGPGARTLGFAVDATRAEGERESERSNRILSLADKIRGGWQGEASAGAFGAALPLAMTAETGSAQLLHSQDLLDRQSGSFHKVLNEVRPVTSAPENPPLDDAFPFDTDHDREVTGYQSDAQHNMAVFGVYDDASRYNETNMPQEYHTSNRGSGDVTVQTPADTIEVGEPSPGPGDSDPRRTAGPGDSSGPADTGFPGGSGPPPGSTTDFPDRGRAPGSSPGQTSPNDFRPEPPPTFGPAFPPANQQSPAAANQGTFTGTLPYSSGYPGGGGGYGPRGGGPAGGPGGGGSASPRPFAPGPGPGAAVGALAAEEAAARRAAQAAATAGARGGMAPMGGAPVAGGRGKDEEDTEHERKVLIESDPEETFGSDVLTAPQVIGDDEYED